MILVNVGVKSYISLHKPNQIKFSQVLDKRNIIGKCKRNINQKKNTSVKSSEVLSQEIPLPANPKCDPIVGEEEIHFASEKEYEGDEFEVDFEEELLVALDELKSLRK